MTTAHRPTWAPARGGEEQGGTRFYAPSVMRSAKDQPAHKELKYRMEGQAAASELKNKDLRAELDAKERKHFAKQKGINFEEEKQNDLLLLEAVPPDGGGKTRELVPRAQDADDVDDDDDDSDESSSDDDDEEEELRAELERIRRERAEEAERKAAEEARRVAAEQEEELRSGNPLLSLGVGTSGGAAAAAGAQVDFGIKRRWDEDVVFKNQTRGEPKMARRFINDTLRSDFHRRFLDRYVK